MFKVKRRLAKNLRAATGKGNSNHHHHTNNNNADSICNSPTQSYSQPKSSTTIANNGNSSASCDNSGGGSSSLASGSVSTFASHPSINNYKKSILKSVSSPSNNNNNNKQKASPLLKNSLDQPPHQPEHPQQHCLQHPHQHNHQHHHQQAQPQPQQSHLAMTKRHDNASSYDDVDGTHGNHHHQQHYNPLLTGYSNTSNHAPLHTLSAQQQQQQQQQQQPNRSHHHHGDNKYHHHLNTTTTTTASATLCSQSTSSSTKKNKTVDFGYVHVREFERILGDNPSCSSGAPIALGWAYGNEKTVLLEYYEKYKQLRGERTQLNLVLTRRAREELLLEWGASFHDIIDAIRANVKAKNQRRRTVNAIGTYDRWEEVMENASRKIKRTLLLKKPKKDDFASTSTTSAPQSLPPKKAARRTSGEFDIGLLSAVQHEFSPGALRRLSGGSGKSGSISSDGTPSGYGEECKAGDEVDIPYHHNHDTISHPHHNQNQTHSQQDSNSNNRHPTTTRTHADSSIIRTSSIENDGIIQTYRTMEITENASGDDGISWREIPPPVPEVYVENPAVADRDSCEEQHEGSQNTFAEYALTDIIIPKDPADTARYVSAMDNALVYVCDDVTLNTNISEFTYTENTDYDDIDDDDDDDQNNDDDFEGLNRDVSYWEVRSCGQDRPIIRRKEVPVVICEDDIDPYDAINGIITDAWGGGVGSGAYSHHIQNNNGHFMMHQIPPNSARIISRWE